MLCENFHVTDFQVSSALTIGCKRFRLEKSDDMGLFLPDGCRLYDDEEVQDVEIVGEKVLYLGEEAPTCKSVESEMKGNFSICDAYTHFCQ